MPPFIRDRFASWQDLWSFLQEDLLTAAFIYFAVTTTFFVVCWLLLRKRLAKRKIQLTKSKSLKQQLSREVRYSLLSMGIFVVMDIIDLCVLSKYYPYYLIYHDVSDYGWGYYLLSFLLMMVVHDAYFYWTHRLMHHPKLFRRVHLVHHRSTDPSPFAAYAFHPLEAIVEWGAFLVFPFLFPVHVSAFLLFQIISLTFNVIGHLGYEIYPKNFHIHWLWRWKTPSTHHNMHHAKFNGNYGLYFTWWDKWMVTEFKDYHAKYEALHNRGQNEQKKQPAVTS